MGKIFCKHSLAQDIRMIPISYNSSEARLFGISCTKCGKYWDHWTPHLRRVFDGKTLLNKLKKCIEVMKG